MLLKIVSWILGMLDFDVALQGDMLHIVIKLGNVTVLDKTIDLIPDKLEGIHRGRFNAKT